MKRCKKCGEVKPLQEFYRAAGMRDGFRNDCKRCFLRAAHDRHAANPGPARERARQWNRENAEHRQVYMEEYKRSGRKRVADRKSHLKRTFGITEADYERILSSQGGGCAICGRPPGGRKLHVDHDHDSGEVRGLLCFACNVAIGHLRDDPMIAIKLLDYLERFKAS